MSKSWDLNVANFSRDTESKKKLNTLELFEAAEENYEDEGYWNLGIGF